LMTASLLLTVVGLGLDEAVAKWPYSLRLGAWATGTGRDGTEPFHARAAAVDTSAGVQRLLTRLLGPARLPESMMPWCYSNHVS